MIKYIKKLISNIFRVRMVFLKCFYCFNEKKNILISKIWYILVLLCISFIADSEYIHNYSIFLLIKNSQN